MDIAHLIAVWNASKAAEKAAIEARRACEDEMVKFYKIDAQKEGTQNFEFDGHKVKIVSRLAQKIDSDKVQEIAAENGFENYLSSLFRWKPEIVAAAWKSAPEEVRNKLSFAITSTPNRPSFTIEVLTTKE